MCLGYVNNKLVEIQSLLKCLDDIVWTGWVKRKKGRYTKQIIWKKSAMVVPHHVHKHQDQDQSNGDNRSGFTNMKALHSLIQPCPGLGSGQCEYAITMSNKRPPF